MDPSTFSDYTELQTKEIAGKQLNMNCPYYLCVSKENMHPPNYEICNGLNQLKNFAPKNDLCYCIMTEKFLQLLIMNGELDKNMYWCYRINIIPNNTRVCIPSQNNSMRLSHNMSPLSDIQDLHSLFSYEMNRKWRHINILQLQGDMYHGMYQVDRVYIDDVMKRKISDLYFKSMTQDIIDMIYMRMYIMMYTILSSMTGMIYGV